MDRYSSQFAVQRRARSYHHHAVPVRKLPFSSTLVLTGLNVYEGLGIGDPEKAKWHDFVFSARGRELKGRDFRFRHLIESGFRRRRSSGRITQLCAAPGDVARGSAASGRVALPRATSGRVAQRAVASRRVAPRGAELWGASLDSAQLQGAELQSAQLQGASLRKWGGGGWRAPSGRVARTRAASGYAAHHGAASGRVTVVRAD